MRLKKFYYFLVFLLFLSAPNSMMAEEYLDIENIEAAIIEKKAGWIADENALTQKSIEEITEMLQPISGESDSQGVNTLPTLDTSSGFEGEPESFTWKRFDGEDLVTPVQKQTSNAGWAYALIGALESQILINEDKDLDLSEEQLISEFCATTPCTLDDIYKVSEYLNTKGILEERCFAYQNGQNDAGAASCENLQSKTVKAFKPQLVDQSILDIKRAIQQTGPVYVEMIVHDDFLAYSGGIYSYITGKVIGKHALLAVGYDDDEKAFLAKNSFGTDWGEDGYVRIAYSEVESPSKFGLNAHAFFDGVEEDTGEDFLWRYRNLGFIRPGQVMRNLSLRPGYVYYARMRLRQDRRNLRFRGWRANRQFPIYGRYGRFATQSRYDMRSRQFGVYQRCQQQRVPRGMYYFSIYPTQQFQNIRLQALFNGPNPNPGPGPNPINQLPGQLRDGDVIRNLSGPGRRFQYSTIRVPNGFGNRSLILRLNDNSGRTAIYVRRGRRPTINRFDAQSLPTGNGSVCRLNNLTPGRYSIGLYARRPFQGVRLNVILRGNNQPSPPNSNWPQQLSNGQIVYNLSCPPNQWRYFRVRGANGIRNLRINMRGANRNANIYVQRGGRPSLNRFWKRSIFSNGESICDIRNPGNSPLFFGFYSRRQAQNITLSARFDGGNPQPPNPPMEFEEIQPGMPKTELSGGSGRWNIYMFNLTENVRKMVVSTRQGMGDITLYANIDNRPRKQQFIQRSAVNNTNDEKIVIRNPRQGWYYFGAHGNGTSYSGLKMRLKLVK